MKENLRKRKLWLKIISVIFSFFIWLYVVSTAEIEKDKSISLNYIVPNGFSLAERYPTNVVLTVRGPRLLVRKFLDREEIVDIEINETFRRGRNRYLYNLQKLVDEPSFGLELVGFTPKNLEIEIEKTIFKKVPVIVDIPENIKDGFNVESFRSTPKNIEISGPQGIVERIKAVKTENLENFDFTTGENQEVSLVSPHSLVSMASSSVVLSYIIDSEVTEFTFKNIPIIFQSRVLIGSVNKRTVDLVVSGSKKSLDEIDSSKIEVIADVSENSPKRQNIELKVTLPSGVELKSISPKTVRVILE